MLLSRQFLIIILTGCFVMACSNSTDHGPVRRPASDHFDGTHFKAPEPIPNKSLLSVLKWRLTSQRTIWSNWVDYAAGTKPDDRVSGLKVTFVNHSTFLLQGGGLNILTDPIWSERASPFTFIGPKRVHAPGIAFDDLPKIDAVIISHSHYDHLDMPTVERLAAKHDPLFIVPLGVDTLIHDKVPAARTQAVDWGQSVALQDDVTITAEPAQHWSARWLGDRNETLWASYVIALPAARVYFAGDSGYASGKIFKDIGHKYGGFDLALIPIGAYEPRWFMAPSHMDPAEAVQTMRDLGARHAIGMHFGTFQLTDEGMDAPVTELAKARDDAGLSAAQFDVLKPGTSWRLPPADIVNSN